MSSNYDNTFFGVFAECLKDINMFFLNGALGVVKYIFRVIGQIPYYVKNFFLRGLPWLYRKIVKIIRCIFSGMFFKFIVNFACLIPALALFASAFSWPLAGWYLCGKVDNVLFNRPYSGWAWLGATFVWTVTFGWFGIKYGLKNRFFSKVCDKAKTCFLPKKERDRIQLEQRKREHDLRVAEERRKMQQAERVKSDFDQMIRRVQSNRMFMEQQLHTQEILKHLKDGTITKEEHEELKSIYSKYGISAECMDSIIEETKIYLKTIGF